MRHNGRYVIYHDENDIPAIRISNQNRQLVYEYFDGFIWHMGGILTPTDGGANRFPSTGQSYIQIDDQTFRVV
jgi:hypothetical protein